MKFPFSINQQFVIREDDISQLNLESILSHIEEDLGYLRMEVRRIKKNELYFSQYGFIGGFSQKNYLQNLFVSIELNSDSINVNLESNTIFILVIGLLPLVILLFPLQEFVPSWIWLASIPTLVLGFGIRLILLGGITERLKVNLMS